MVSSFGVGMGQKDQHLETVGGLFGLDWMRLWSLNPALAHPDFFVLSGQVPAHTLAMETRKETRKETRNETRARWRLSMRTREAIRVQASGLGAVPLALPLL